MFTSRELASILLLSTPLLWAMTHRDVRSSMGNVLRAFFRTKILAVLVCSGAYIAGWTWLAAKIDLWNDQLLKDTIVWFVVAGFPLLLQVDEAGWDEQFFHRTVQSIIELSVLVSFFINTISFHLVVELVLQFLIALLVMVTVVGGADQRYAPVKRFCEACLAIMGVTLLTVTTVDLYQNQQDLAFGQLGRSLVLAYWLPLVALPFMYVFGLVASYERAFIRMQFVSDRQAPIKAKLAVLLGLNGHVQDVNALAGSWARRVVSAPTFGVALERVREFRRHRDKQRWEQMERES